VAKDSKLGGTRLNLRKSGGRSKKKKRKNKKADLSDGRVFTGTEVKKNSDRILAKGMRSAEEYM